MQNNQNLVELKIKNASVIIECNSFYTTTHINFFVKNSISSYYVGIPHFLEHLIVDFTDEYKFFGGIPLYGFTSPIFTRYSIDCLYESFVEIFQKLHTIIFKTQEIPDLSSNLFSPRHFNNIREIVLKELKELHDNPLNHLQVEFIYYVGNNFLYAPTTGTIESIKNITPQLIKRYMTNTYILPNLRIVIFTDRNPKEIVDTLTSIIPYEKYSSVFYSNNTVNNVNFSAPPDKIMTIDRKSEICYVCIGFKIPPAIKINPLEGKIILSPLTQITLRTSLDYEIYSIRPFQYIIDGGGIIGTSFAVESKMFYIYFKKIMQLLFNLQSATQIEKAIADLKRSYKLIMLNRLQDIDKRAIWYSQKKFGYGIDDEIQQLNNIKVDELMDKIGALFNKKNLYVGILGPANIYKKTYEKLLL